MTNRTSRLFHWLPTIAYLYILLPPAIFFVGWTNRPVGFLGLLFILFAWLKLSFRNSSLHLDDSPKILPWKAIAVFLLIALWVCLSGIGRLAYQNTDHNCRNAVYEALVNNRWPVIKQVETENQSQDQILTYYIGFWLPSAVFGKVFGLTAGYYFQVVWAILGISIFYLLVCVYLKRFCIWPFLLFVFFSGLDVVGIILTGHCENLADPLSHLEWWCNYQYSSFTTQLFWVFNQAIPAWVVFMLYILQKNNKYLLLLSSGALLSCPLPFVGMLPFILYSSFHSLEEDRRLNTKLKTWFCSFITSENIVGLLLDAVIFTYLCGNSASQLLGNNVGNLTSSFGILELILFAAVEFGVYFILIFRCKKGGLCYLSLACLLIIPLVKIGYGADFCMRVSIPSLLVLYLLVAQTITDARKQKKRFLTAALVSILCIGSITPIHELTRSVYMTAQSLKTGAPSYQDPLPEDQLLTDANFSGPASESLFRFFAG